MLVENAILSSNFEFPIISSQNYPCFWGFPHRPNIRGDPQWFPIKGELTVAPRGGFFEAKKHKKKGKKGGENYSELRKTS